MSLLQGRHGPAWIALLLRGFHLAKRHGCTLDAAVLEEAFDERLPSERLLPVFVLEEGRPGQEHLALHAKQRGGHDEEVASHLDIEGLQRLDVLEGTVG